MQVVQADACLDFRGSESVRVWNPRAIGREIRITDFVIHFDTFRDIKRVIRRVRNVTTCADRVTFVDYEIAPEAIRLSCNAPRNA